MAVKRRLTIYPGQISMVFNVEHAEEFHAVFTANLKSLPLSQRPVVERFLYKISKAIETGKRLSAKQSAVQRGLL